MTIEFRFEAKLPNIVCSILKHDTRPIKRTTLLVYNQLPEKQCQRCGREFYATENKVNVGNLVTFKRLIPKKLKKKNEQRNKKHSK